MRLLRHFGSIRRFFLAISSHLQAKPKLKTIFRLHNSSTFGWQVLHEIQCCIFCCPHQPNIQNFYLIFRYIRTNFLIFFELPISLCEKMIDNSDATMYRRPFSWFRSDLDPPEGESGSRLGSKPLPCSSSLIQSFQIKPERHLAHFKAF